MSERISSMGELVCGRTLEKTETGFVPGQHHAKIIDPKPHRDRGDLAAVLTYVDDEGLACSVLCIRYRDEGWRSITVHRAGLTRSERSTVAGKPELEGELLTVVERAAEGVDAFPYEPPSEEEQKVRRLAHKLIDHVERNRAAAPRNRHSSAQIDTNIGDDQ